MNESILRTRVFTIRYAHMRVVFQVQFYKKLCTLLARILHILNSDWLQLQRSVHRVYESLKIKIFLFCGFALECSSETTTRRSDDIAQATGKQRPVI